MSSFVQGGRSSRGSLETALGGSARPTPADGSKASEIASPARDPAGTSTLWAVAARSMGMGQRLGAGCAIGLWLGDVALLAGSRASVGWVRWLTGMGAALFVALTTALVLGALAGFLMMPMVATTAEFVRARWLRLREGVEGARRGFAAGLLAVVGLVCVASLVSYRVSLATELAFTGPRTMAVQLTLAHLAFVAAFAFALPWSLRWARSAVDWAEDRAGMRWVFAHPWRLLALLGAVVVVTGGVLAFAFKATLEAIPWRNGAALPGLVLGLAVALYLPRIRGRLPRRVLVSVAIGLEVLALSAGAVAATRLRPESTTARKLAFDRALSGSLGYSVWLAVFDFDRDGQLSMLGGGDCAPFDPRRYSGALDIPGNGIDEDCDGSDLHMVSIGPRPRMRVGQEALAKRPNIILVTVDALAAPRLSALGGGESIMPNVDALAREGTLFTHCFSQGPSTRLSFPSMFTSRWDSQLTHLFAPVHPYPISPTDRQLQDVLNEAGYETIAVIPDSYFGSARWSSVTRGFQRVDSSAIPSGKNNAQSVTTAALRALAGTTHDRPVYLWVHYYDAHLPYQAPSDVRPARMNEEGLYEAELTHIDRALAPLIAAVEARPEPTYLFFTADHATVFHPDPSTRRGHYGYDLYTATLHVPLIIRGPGIVPGRADGVVSTMDIAPTIADILRLTGDVFEGNSLLPEMMAGRVEPERMLFHEFYLPERGFRGEDPLQIVSVRNRRYNLVLDRTKGMYELYDWGADYFERTDLYEDRARSPDVMQLRSALSSFLLRFHSRWVRGLEMAGSP